MPQFSISLKALTRIPLQVVLKMSFHQRTPFPTFTFLILVLNSMHDVIRQLLNTVI